MGNNKKTVKCSFCGRLGHNRVSCPKLKEMIEKEREEHGSDHPDVKLYDEMSVGYSKKSSNNASRTRHCKYCFMPNHNVRSCKDRARDISELKKRNHYWRMAVLEFFRKRGIGTGCIMTNKYSKRYGSKMYNKGDKWILTSINWDLITFDIPQERELGIDDYKVFKLVNLTNSMVTTSLSMSQLAAINEHATEAEFYWDVLSPSQTLDFPEGWDTIGDKEYDKHLMILFKNINKRNYEGLISYSFRGKPFIILQKAEQLLAESSWMSQMGLGGGLEE